MIAHWGDQFDPGVAVHSAFWAIAQQLFRQALVAAFMVILARKVSPAEFGLIGIATICNTFLHLFLELGFCAALVQRKEITPGHISAAFSINVAAGFLVTLLGWIASVPLSAAMGAPDAAPVIGTLSICFLVTSAASTSISLVQRALNFKALALRDFAGNAVAIIVGIVLAAKNFGVWSVVASSIILNLLNACFVWRLAPLTFHRPTREHVRDVFPFGAKVFAHTGLKYLLRSIDSIAVGLLFGPDRLGVYNFSNRITAAPTKALQIGLASFLFPRAAKTQDHPSMLEDLFWLTFKALAYPVALFSIALGTVGTDMILLVFGNQWAAAVPIINVLILAQLASALFIPVAELLKATNRPNTLLAWSSLMAAVAASALWIGSLGGFEYSLGLLVAGNWLLVPVSAVILHRLLPITPTRAFLRLRVFLLIVPASGLAAFLLPTITPLELAVRSLLVSLIGLACLASALALDSDVRRLATLIRRHRG